MYDGSSAVTEHGTVSLDPTAKAMAIDLVSTSGQRRSGLCEITGGTMHLAIANPGDPRPGSAESGSVYTTQP